MIREATLADVPRLVEMAQRFLNTSHYGTVLAENPAQMGTLMIRLISQDDSEVLVIDRGEVIGMLGLVVFLHPWSGRRVTAELVWWVEPEVRGEGVKLLKAGEQWAIAHASEQFQMTAPTARLGAFYTKLGYQQIEIAFQKELAGPR